MLIRRANCKINLALDVTARRGDGWHDIDSVLVPIDWHDLVGVALRPADRARISLSVTGELAGQVPRGDDNLMLRAAAILAEIAQRPVEIALWLDKHVPSAAGLGGGSADAAAVLRAGAEQLTSHGIAVDGDALQRAAMSIGSDVPALLAGGALRVRGRGDTLEPLASAIVHIAVAVTEPSSTGAAYAALHADELCASGRVDRLVASMEEGGIDDMVLGSALEAPARRVSAKLDQSLARLRALTPDRRWHMTGSGGALFCIGRDHVDAQTLAQRARGAGFVARASRTVAS